MSGKYFTGDQKLSKKLIGRTKEALRQRNVQFAQTHGDASDEELLDYVRGEAARLGMTPNAGEIIGGHFIAVRFGCWKNVVTAAGWSRRRSRSPSPSGRSSRRSSAVRRESGHTQSNRTAASNPDEEGDPLLPS
ncbi:MAG: homing endonuclease associated repeat-containing protein [Flavonifractor plautii]